VSASCAGDTPPDVFFVVIARDDFGMGKRSADAPADLAHDLWTTRAELDDCHVADVVHDADDCARDAERVVRVAGHASRCRPAGHEP